MKKLLITLSIVFVFTLVFLFSFRFLSGAQDIVCENTEATLNQAESEDGFDKTELYLYIKDRIVPIVIGVLTSLSALLATLGAIKRSLNKIAEAKEDFKREAKTREESFKRESEYLSVKAEELSKICAQIPKLEGEISELSSMSKRLAYEGELISKMIELGFSQNKQIISSGNGRKINRLSEECQSLFKNNQGVCQLRQSFESSEE